MDLGEGGWVRVKERKSLGISGKRKEDRKNIYLLF
jgi:hypothetical protein